jgi:hypothetical protein
VKRSLVTGHFLPTPYIEFSAGDRWTAVREYILLCNSLNGESGGDAGKAVGLATLDYPPDAVKLQPWPAEQ